MGKAYLSLALVFFVSLVVAESVPNSLNLNLQVTDSSGNPTTGTYTFIFNLTNQPDCTSAFYTNSTTLTTDARGIISYTLTNVNSSFDQKTYLCYYRDGVLKSNISVAQVPNAFKAKNVSASGIVPDSNLNISSKNITADWLDGKLNYSNIQNHPVFLTQTVGDLLYCKLTGCNITGNLVAQNVNVSGNLTLSDRICNATACYTLSDLNNSASETDPLAIHLDGSSITTAMINFSKGISVGNSSNFTLNSSAQLTSDWNSGNKKITSGSLYIVPPSDGGSSTPVHIVGPLGTTVFGIRFEGYYTDGIRFDGTAQTTDSSISNIFAIEDETIVPITSTFKNYWSVGAAPFLTESNNASYFAGFLSSPYTRSIPLAYQYSGIVAEVDAFDSQVSWLTGTAVNYSMYHGREASIGGGGGTIQNLYGLHLEDITSGSVSNYAIKTGLGKVEFGDNVNATKNITIGSIGNPGCITIRNVDDDGWSHIQMRNGTIVNGTGAC